MEVWCDKSLRLLNCHVSCGIESKMWVLLSTNTPLVMDFAAFHSLAMSFAAISKASLGFSTPKCVEAVIKEKHQINKVWAVCML